MPDQLQCIFAAPFVVFGVYFVLREVLDPGRITLVKLSLFSFALQFCLGPFLSGFNGTRDTTASSGDILLSWGVAYLLWFAVLMVALVWRPRAEGVVVLRGDYWKPSQGIFALLTDASLQASVGSLVGLCLVTTAIRLWLMWQYRLGISGISTFENTLGLPYALIIVFDIASGIGMAFGYAGVTKLLYRQPGAIWTLWILGEEFFFSFLCGRRWVFGFLFLCVFAMIVKHGKFKVRQAVIGVLTALVLWWFVFPLFYNLRQEWQQRSGAPIREWVSRAWHNVTTKDEFGGAESAYRQGVNERLNAFQLNYVVANKLQNGLPTAHGECLSNGLMLMIPRVLYPEKLLSHLPDDALLNNKMMLGEVDQVSNFPVFALADFGLLGGVVYGLVFIIGLRITQVLIHSLRSRSPVGLIAVVSILCSRVCLQMEFGPSNYMGTIRLCLIVYILFVTLGSFARRSAEMEPFAYPSAVYPPPEYR